jgi:excisionase family DNA binding protein
LAKELYTISEVAELLSLHVKTIRRHVKQGRLNSVRTGNQYRITRADIEAFSGSPLAVLADSNVTVATEVSSVVTVEGINAKTGERITAFLHAAIKGRNERQALKVETLYDAVRIRLRIVILGSLETTQELLHMIEHLAHQSTAATE